jgi:lipopolysaccharide transport system permease protein
MSKPGHDSFFANLAQKRELWWQFTVRAVELRHRGSHLGLIWALLNPLLMLLVYYVVFGVIFGGSFKVLRDETTADFVLAVFFGLIAFHLAAETMTLAPTVVVTNPNLVKKVVFPLEVLPLAQLGAAWFHFLISLALMLLGALFFGRGLTLEGLAWLPLILLPLLLFSVGIAWLCAALGVFFRDLAQVMPFLSQVLLYASAVFYSVEKAQALPGVWMFLKWNPLLHTVNLARNALLWDQPVNVTYLVYTYVCGISICLLGGWVFRKLQPAFADVI